METAFNYGGALTQALTRWPQIAPTPGEQELQLLTSYMLGDISLEEANDLLREQGRLLVALYRDQLVEA